MQLLGYMLNSLAKHPISGRARTNTHTHTYAPLDFGWWSEPLWNKLWQSALTNTDLKTSNQSPPNVFSHPHYCLYSYTPYRYKLGITSIWSHISQSDAFPTTSCWWIIICSTDPRMATIRGTQKQPNYIKLTTHPNLIENKKNKDHMLGRITAQGGICIFEGIAPASCVECVAESSKLLAFFGRKTWNKMFLEPFKYSQGY